MSERYQGMVFVYGKGARLDEKLVAIVKILLKRGFKWLWSEGKKRGYGLEWDGKKYKLKRYKAVDIGRLVIYSGAEWLIGVEAEEIKIIGKKDVDIQIYEYCKQENRLNLYSVPFPPVEYYKKYGIKYDRENPFPPDELIINEDGNKVEIYSYEKRGKRAIIIDFWSLYRYFIYSEPPLSEAVEEFVVDLMREIAMATEAEYGYMNLEERRPLEYDPICGDMNELVRLWRGDGLYTVWNQMMWVRKEVMLKEFDRERLKKVKERDGREWEIKIEEHGDFLFLYPERPLSNYEYVEYRYEGRKEEESMYRELGIPMFGVCGEMKEGISLDITYFDRDAKDKYKDKVLRWAEKYGIDVKIVDH